jgi:hypothetical protein
VGLVIWSEGILPSKYGLLDPPVQCFLLRMGASYEVKAEKARNL